MAQIVIGDKFLRRAAQDLLLLPVNKFPGLAEIPRTPRFHFHKHKRVAFERDDVQFAGSATVAPRQDVEALPQQKTAAIRSPFRP